MATQRVRVGLIGTGRRGHQHLVTLGELPEYFELAAVCDLSESSAARAGQRFGVPSYTNIQEFLAKSKLDAIMITTPAETHHLVAQAAAVAGVPLFIETPLAVTRRMMDVISETADRDAIRVEVGENMWRRPTEQLNMAVVQAGIIGKVLRVSSFYESAGHDSCYHTMSMMRIYAGADVNLVRGLAQRFALDPSVTTPDGASIGPPGYGVGVLESETWTQATLHYANGVMGSCTYVTGWVGPLRRGHPRFMTIEGTEGFIVTGDGDVNMLRRVEHGVPATYEKLMEMAQRDGKDVPLRYYYDSIPQLSYANPFRDRVLTDAASTGSPSDGLARAHELMALRAMVSDGAEPAYSISQARRDQELSIAITESARQGLPLHTSELPDETEWERGEHEKLWKLWGGDPFRDAASILKNATRS